MNPSPVYTRAGDNPPMFIAAKLLAFLTQPLAWVVLLLAMALLLQRRWRRASTTLSWSALLLLLLLGWEPLPDALLRNLETQYPAPVHIDLRRYAGVVVLGGAMDYPYVWEGHAQPALTGAAERMTAALPLLQQAPQLKLLFTGGTSELTIKGLTEAERARRFYAAMDVDPQRLLLESASRTTHENAVFSAQLPGVDKTQPWLLLTSAWHMPRSVATFRKAGWNVTPWPADYRAGLETPWMQYSAARGAEKWQTALHELLGLWIYRLSGRA